MAAAIRDKGDIKFGMYYCLTEWLNPLYVKDKESNFTSDEFVQVCNLAY